MAYSSTIDNAYTIKRKIKGFNSSTIGLTFRCYVTHFPGGKTIRLQLTIYMVQLGSFV